MRAQDLVNGQMYGASRKADFSAEPVRLADPRSWRRVGDTFQISHPGRPLAGVLAVRSLRHTERCVEQGWVEQATDLASLPLPMPGLVTDGKADPEAVRNLMRCAAAVDAEVVVDNSSRWAGPWEAYSQMRRNFLADRRAQAERAEQERRENERRRDQVQGMVRDLGLPMQASTPGSQSVQVDLDWLHRLVLLAVYDPGSPRVR